MYYAFIQNGKLNGIGQCRILNEDYNNLEISKNLYDAMKHDVDKYVYHDGKIVLDENNPVRIARLSREVRTVRDTLLAETDKFSLADFPITESEKVEYLEYRKYLRDYTKVDEWWKKHPLIFAEWKIVNKERSTPVPSPLLPVPHRVMAARHASLL